jgi:hypothetical protein
MGKWENGIMYFAMKTVDFCLKEVCKKMMTFPFDAILPLSFLLFIFFRPLLDTKMQQ